MPSSPPRPVGHHLLKCSCGRVISQCRCMGPKETIVRPHPACGMEPPLNPLTPILDDDEVALPSSPISCGVLPGCKRPVLWEERDGVIVPLAYFVDREAMDRYLAFSPRTNRTPKEPDA